MKLLEIVAGDIIDAPFWPHRVTVTEVRRSRDGVLARVFWTAPEGDGVNWLSERATVRRVWDFRSLGGRERYQPPPSRLRDAVQSMTVAQREAGIGADCDDCDATATMAALMEGEW